MYNPKEKVKFSISKSMKDLNRRYRRNYTLNDVALSVGLSRETMSRMTTDSPFSQVYAVAMCLYEFYPEYNDNLWDFCKYANLLCYEDCSFMM